MSYFASEEGRRFAQQIAEAYTPVLNMHMAVFNRGLSCVAGTGVFAGCVGGTAPANSAVARVVSDGMGCFIESPGRSEECGDCTEKDGCHKKATLIAPVRLENATIGAVALAAPGSRERHLLAEKLGQYTEFLDTTAELLAAKISSSVKAHENLLLASDLNAISEAYPYGIMSIDSANRVTHFNSNAERILNIPARDIIGRDYTGRLECDILDNALATASNFQSVHAAIAVDGHDADLIISIQPIFQNYKLAKVVCFFREYHETGPKETVHDTVKYSFNSIQGQSPEIKATLELVEKFAPSNSTVLITGESGTGKELFAKAIHYASSRSDHPFIALNCSAIPDNLLESELFGYVKGAFTSASTSGKVGKFELANKGTIFLDEIGDMALNLQAKLLRVLQERKIERLGDTKSIDVDIRVIAATNKDLMAMVEQKLFREDLYYRINVIPLSLPPLRERQSDIPLLAVHFLKKYSALMLKNITGFHPKAMSLLNEYTWPGNVRELENAIEYAVNIENSAFILPGSLPMSILHSKSRVIPAMYGPAPSEEEPAQTLPPTGANLKSSIEELERAKIVELLEQYGNSTEAKRMVAQKLNISISTLYRKLKKNRD